MISAEQLTLLKDPFPFFSDPHANLTLEMMAVGQLHSFTPGQIIFTEGDECTALALVVEGEIRVYKQGESGREITLYRLESGESCILTASCILNEESFPALAVVEKPSTALIIPANYIRAWMSRYPAWQDFVFRLISRRLGNIISVVEEVTFRRMDQRLAEYLGQNFTQKGSALSMTHQDIADELGTAREVISRLLKEFEQSRIVELQRGLIRLIDRKRLTRLASE
ncbi:MAG: Crp/Fnr family transcriptional regulator [FCB group bacterium]|nr:Crp/Fnr family transcriptional regulator [FCB group bacterium]